MNSWDKIVKDRKCWEDKMEKKFDLENELEMLLDDQLIREAELLEKELFADDSFEDYQETPEERKASYEKLIDRLKADGIYREDTVSENVSAEHTAEDVCEEVMGKEHNFNNIDEKELKEHADKVIDLRAAEKNSKKIRRKFGKSMAKVASIVVVSGLCVFAASMTSEANRNYFLNNLRVLSGNDTKVVNSNDENNDLVSADEYSAIADIENTLQIEVPEFYYRPSNFDFLSYEVDSIARIARIEYTYNEYIFSFHMYHDIENINTDMNSMHGDEIETFKMLYENIDVTVGKIESIDDGIPSYYAVWKRKETSYFIVGKIEYAEFREIINNLAF